MTDPVLVADDRREPALAGEDLLIDRFLPRFDVTLIEHVVADADIAGTWQAVRARHRASADPTRVRRRAAACSGDTVVTGTPVASSSPAGISRRGTSCSDQARNGVVS